MERQKKTGQKLSFQTMYINAFIFHTLNPKMEKKKKVI